MIYLMYKSPKFGLVLTVTYLHIYIYNFIIVKFHYCVYHLMNNEITTSKVSSYEFITNYNQNFYLKKFKFVMIYIFWL